MKRLQIWFVMVFGAALIPALSIAQGLSQFQRAPEMGSPIVLVSDIDDTIKVSHVLDGDGIIRNALRLGNVFRGMPLLYRELVRANRNSHVYYLTNAPEVPFSKIHGRFLSQNSFPGGRILLRPDIRDEEFKIDSLRQLARLHPRAVFILIGDNGERDPLFYAQFAQEFPQTRSLVFIREVYSSFHSDRDERGTRLQPGQIGFVTPVEIALYLKEVQLLSERQVQIIEQSYIPETLRRSWMEDRDGDEGELSFPKWQDCRDHRLSPLVAERRSGLTSKLVQRIQERCTRAGLESLTRR